MPTKYIFSYLELILTDEIAIDSSTLHFGLRKVSEHIVIITVYHTSVSRNLRASQPTHFFPSTQCTLSIFELSSRPCDAPVVQT